VKVKWIFGKHHCVALFLISASLCWVEQRLEGSFRIPYQSFEPLLDCEVKDWEGGYFRPEYVELVERLDPETIEWLVRTYPVLGWQRMDRRVYTPKAIPGADVENAFRYDTVRRYMELESLFHFGPLGGNGTLIAELLELDENRLVTVNRGSSNLSVINVKNPDVAGVIPSLQGLEALEFNLHAQELYLAERNALGMLVYSLENYTVSDTLFLGFHPKAVFLSSDTRYLYLTDESSGSLVRYDLAGNEEPRKVRTGLQPPYLLAGETDSGKIILISRSSGEISVFDPRNIDTGTMKLSVSGRLLSFCAPRQANLLYLASGDCEFSDIYCLSLTEGKEISLERILNLRGPVSRLTSDSQGRILYALAGSDLYRIDVDQPDNINRVSFQTHIRNILAYEGKVFVSGGLTDLFVFKEDLSSAKPGRVTLEMGPGPMVASGGRLYVANGLSNSITFLSAKTLEEEISVLVGVLIGRMVYENQRIVVNNCFRNNVMVLNPDDLIIEEIVPVGGSMEYSPGNRDFVFFDDSLVVSMESPPSKVSIHNSLDLPQGVKLFSSTKNSDVFLIVDQDRYITQVDLKRRFRRGMIPLPADCKGLFTLDQDAWVFAPTELYRLSIGETIGLSRTFSARPFKISPPFVATDGFSRRTGSIINLLSQDRLLDILSTQGEIRVMRQDPDTANIFIGTSRNVYVFALASSRQKYIIPVEEGVDDIYLPAGSIHGYLASPEKITIFDRETLFRRDEIEVGGSFVYVSGNELFLRDRSDPRKLIVADGYRGMIFQELTLPVIPTDAASDSERLFLLGGTEGALAVYVNRVDTARLPRSPDRQAWDPDADRRSKTHR